MNRRGDTTMKLRTMRYYMTEALQSFWRNRFMSIASIATVALSLFILGLFLTLVANLDTSPRTWKARSRSRSTSKTT